MKSALKTAAEFALVGAIFLALVLIVRALPAAEPRIPSGAVKWLIYKPAGAVDGQGILRDVTSRCTPSVRQTMYDADQETYTHEATHGLNSIIRNKMGGTSSVNAFYVGNGLCVVLPEPKLRLSWVRQYVRTKHPTPTLAWSSWENEPLYLVDELSAYLNGLQWAKETGRPSHGSNTFAPAMCDWNDALVAAIKAHDPNYAELQALIEFIAYQKQRCKELLK